MFQAAHRNFSNAATSSIRSWAIPNYILAFHPCLVNQLNGHLKLTSCYHCELLIKLNQFNPQSNQMNYSFQLSSLRSQMTEAESAKASAEEESARLAKELASLRSQKQVCIEVFILFIYLLDKQAWACFVLANDLKNNRSRNMGGSIT